MKEKSSENLRINAFDVIFTSFLTFGRIGTATWVKRFSLERIHVERKKYIFPNHEITEIWL